MQDEEQESATDIASATMLGDLMNVVIDCAKALPKPWQELGEFEQSDWLASIEKQCETAIQQCVTLIAGMGHTTVAATLKRVVFKDGVEATLQIDRHANHRIDLADAAGQVVRLVLIPEDIMGHGGKPTAEPNQKSLTLEQDESEAGNDGEPDPHLQIAIEFVRTSRKCTISAVQRNLSIGYNRAARLVEALEKAGVVSAMDSEGKRFVLSERATEEA